MAEAKWTRMLLRELYDRGYTRAAASLEQEAGVALRSPAMQELERLLRAADWDGAGKLVDSGRLEMRSPIAQRKAKLRILKAKYMHHLEQRQLTAALRTFQHEIRPQFNLDEQEIRSLAMLLLCKDADTLHRMVEKLWVPHKSVLDEVETLVSAHECIPRGALQRVVHAGGLDWNEEPFTDAENVTVDCAEVVLRHNGEVVSVSFSPDGEWMATAGADRTVIVWKLGVEKREGLWTQPQRTLSSTHAISNVLWSPTSNHVLTTSATDGTLELWDTMTGDMVHSYDHGDIVSCAAWLPSGLQFVSGSAEKSLILWDRDGTEVYRWHGRRILDLAVDDDGGVVYALVQNTEVRAYHIVTKADVEIFHSDQMIAAIAYSSTTSSQTEGATRSRSFLLLQFIQEETVGCLDVLHRVIIARYQGSFGQRYVRQPCFAGVHNELVVAGGEDGRLQVWLRDSAKQCAVGSDGHGCVVNVVARHPVHPNVVVSVSDDETVRFWRIRSKEDQL